MEHTERGKRQKKLKLKFLSESFFVRQTTTNDDDDDSTFEITNMLFYFSLCFNLCFAWLSCSPFSRLQHGKCFLCSFALRARFFFLLLVLCFALQHPSRSVLVNGFLGFHYAFFVVEKRRRILAALRDVRDMQRARRVLFFRLSIGPARFTLAIRQ